MKERDCSGRDGRAGCSPQEHEGTEQEGCLDARQWHAVRPVAGEAMGVVLSCVVVVEERAP
jgi:hypothetical protein